MANLRLYLTIVLLSCGSYETVRAALPSLSPEELERYSKLVVTGSVSNIEAAQDGWGDSIDWAYTLEAKIDSVEKGDAATVGDTITIHCWQMARRPDGWAGPSGHSPIPAQDSRFRMWLSSKEEGAWEPLKPNGIELLDGSPAFVTPEIEEAPRNLLLLVTVIGAAVIVAVVAAIVLRRGGNSGPVAAADDGERR